MKFILALGHGEQDKWLIRHNAGYQVLDWLCQKYEVDLHPEKWDFFHIVNAKIGEQDVTFAKLCVPSHEIGEYLASIIKVWKLNIKDIIVIHDDQNIDFGKVIYSFGGKGGNHTAVNSIIEALGTSHFHRVRVGVGTHSQPNNRRYLLSEYSEKQFNKLPKVLGIAADEVEKIVLGKR